MKRVLSIVLVALMYMSFTAFADDYDLLNVQYTGYEAKMNFSFDVTNPKALANIMPAANHAVNVEQMVAELKNTELYGTVKFNSNKEFSKMQISYELFSSVPLKINKNLKLTGEFVFGMWVDLDITDDVHPVFNVIYDTPFSDKYINFNFASMLEKQGVNPADAFSPVKSMLTPENMAKQSADFTEIIRKNSSLTASASKVKITANREQAEKIVAEVSQYLKDYMSENKDIELLTDDTGVGYVFPSAKTVEKFFKKHKIFADTAFEMELGKTKSGMLSSQKIKVNFEGNTMEMAGAADVMEPQILGISVAANASYKNINKSTKIDFPVLTNENSVDAASLSYDNYTPDYAWDTENCWHTEHGYVRGSDFVGKDGAELYLPIMNAATDLNEYGHDYSASRYGDSITVTDLTGNENFNSASFTVGSKTYTIDGVNYEAKLPALSSKKAIYVSFDAFEKVFDAKITYAEVYLETNSVNIGFSRQSPMCHHTEEEQNMHDDDDYYEVEEEFCNHYNIIDFYGEMPYNGIEYISLRELSGYILSNENSEITYENGTVTLRDGTGYEKFGTAVFTAGSREILTDGNVFTADNPVVEYADVIYIDKSAAKAVFGFDEYTDERLNYYRNYDENGNFMGEFAVDYSGVAIRKNPACPHSEKELADYEKWWK